MMYVRICKYCGIEFSANWYNASTCPDCKKRIKSASSKKYREKYKKEIAEKNKKRYYRDHEATKARQREQKHLRWARLHHKVERHCPDCGALLESSHAQRCQACAVVHHREYARERSAQKRAERRALRALELKKKKPEARHMDESISRAKQASVKVSKMHKAMERDVRAKEKAEQNRISASVALLKKIHAKYQREKRAEEEFFKSIR